MPLSKNQCHQPKNQKELKIVSGGRGHGVMYCEIRPHQSILRLQGRGVRVQLIIFPPALHYLSPASACSQVLDAAPHVSNVGFGSLRCVGHVGSLL